MKICWTHYASINSVTVPVTHADKISIMPMRMIILFLVFGFGLTFAKDEAGSWRSGRVIAAVVSGHGPAGAEVKRKVLRETDIWWTYCISSDELFYSVLSRENPERTGLTNNRLVRFSERKNQIYVVSPRGKSLALRILRKDKSKKCP